MKSFKFILLSVFVIPVLLVIFSSCNELNTKDLFYAEGGMYGNIPCAKTESLCKEMIFSIKCGEDSFMKMRNEGKVEWILEGLPFHILEIHDETCRIVMRVSNDTLWIPKNFIITEEYYHKKIRADIYRRRNSF